MNGYVLDLKEAARRAARTFVQVALGVYLAGIAGPQVNFDALANVGLLESAASAGFVAVLSFVQNAIEDIFPEVDTR